MYRPVLFNLTDDSLTACSLSTHANPCVHSSVVVLLVVVQVLQEEVLVCTISGESNGSNAQPGEGALEAVPSGEGPGVPPHLTAKVRL